MTFSFGGNTGMTYEQMLAARNYAAQQRQDLASDTPKNWGEGVGALMKAFGARVAGGRADKAATEGREKAQSALGTLLQSRLGGSAPAPQSASFLPPQGSTPAPAPSLGNDGGIQRFPASLVQSESGGNWGALNDEGYGGRLQFGEARLADAARAGIIPAGVNGAAFSQMPPEMQQRVEQWHFADIDSQAQRMGLDRYVGQTVGGVPITQDGIRAMAHLGGIGGAQKFLQSGGKSNPADSNGTSLRDYAAQHGGASGGGQAMALSEGQQPDLSFLSQMGGQGMDPRLMELMSHPYVSELPQMQQGALAAMFQQQLAQAYPEQMTPYQQQQTQLDREKFDWQREQASTGGGDLPASVQEAKWRAEQAGLVPGTREYQAFILNSGGDPATFRALDMQARAAGLAPDTPEYQDFMGTRGAGLAAGASQTAKNVADIDTGGEAARVKSAGSEQGKADVVAGSELAEMQRNMPSLLVVADQLEALAPNATYTKGGQFKDEVAKQLGWEPGEGAVARAEYVAIIDNQILPLLRQTFGAAFTQKEGETLKATLGNPNGSPAEKNAVLRAFIAQKERDLIARGGAMPNAAPAVPDTELSDDDLLTQYGG